MDVHEDERQVELFSRAGKAAAKRLAKAAAKKAVLLAGKALAAIGSYLLALIGIPAGIVLAVALLICVVFAAFYSAMPGGATLTGVEPSERDAQIKIYAVEQANRWNMEETWLVSGEGRWYPSQGGIRLGMLVDRFGQDRKLALEWGDVYAPVLYCAAQIPGEDKFQDEEWVKGELDDAAENLRPWFYYKESYVEYCDADGECDRETVYLLVEAYTIKGHYTFKYRWVTKTFPDGGSVTYEEPAGQERLADGYSNYIKPYIIRAWDIPDDEQAVLAARAILEAGAAFSAQAENTAWLMDKTSLVRLVSGASIPAEFRGYLEEAERLTGIPAWFLAAIIERESSWNPAAVNDDTGCFGLTQLHPDYWPDWAGRYGFDAEADKWNPRAQIIVGAYVLAGYGADKVDWDGLDFDDPPDALKRALARYGGYGNDVDAAGDYINDILELARAYGSRPAAWPVPGYYDISSHFGWRIHPIFGDRRFHGGIDIPAPTGSDVVSVSGGVVYAVIDSGSEGYGLHVRVRDAQYEYLYAHLSRVDVRVGQVLKPGDRIGAVGNTGWSKGPHLHFGIRPPGCEGDNGWIDPEPGLRGLDI